MKIFIYRIALNKHRGEKDNFTPNREIMIYICIDLGNPYVANELSNVFIYHEAVGDGQVAQVYNLTNFYTVNTFCMAQPDQLKSDCNGPDIYVYN